MTAYNVLFEGDIEVVATKARPEELLFSSMGRALRQAGQLNRVRILLADDHPGFPQLVKSMLEPSFEIIGSVSNGRSLIDAAMKLRPDVVVTDISMPILNGLDAATQLRKSGCESKIVFLSIHSDPDFVRACLSIGALGYVTKPRMATELVHAIQEALAGRVFVSAGGRP